MKVLFICEYMNPNSGSGIAKSGYYLYKSLKRKVNIILISLKRYHANFIKKYLKFFIILIKIFEVLRKKSRILTYIHFQENILLSIPYILKYPSIICIHDIIPLRVKERKFLCNIYFKLNLLLLRFLIKYRKIHIIVPSKCVKRDLIAFGFPSEKIAVVKWGVDNKYRPIKNLQEIKYKRNKIVIGFLGCYSKKSSRKKVDLLIDAYLELKRKYPNIELVLAGKYPKWFVEKYKENVKFLGALPEEKVPEFYNSLDIFVYPSLFEGFGMQIVESMACKTLVIASNIPVFREYLPKELLFNLSKEDLVKKLEEFLDKEKIKIYSEKLYEMSKNYTWKETSEKIIKLFRELLIKK